MLLDPSTPPMASPRAGTVEFVTATGAEQLAAAPERALPDIPDTDVLAPYRDRNGSTSFAPDVPEIDAMDWLCDPQSKDYIREFIRYRRAGAFTIG
jgi:hypothetical protein